MLIAQITDLHIGRDGASALNDARLNQVVAKVAAAAPDLVIATGDLSEGGSAQAYQRVRARLSPLTMPVLPLIGNHDHRDALLQAFDLTPDPNGFAQGVHDQGDLRIIGLDTVEAGAEGGAFCDLRAGWLNDRLDEAPDRPTLIAMHHPPIRTGIGWMDDRTDGPWTDRLGQILDGRRQVVGLIAGHLHRTMTTRFRGHSLVVAPSSAPQVVLDLTSGSPRSFRPRIIQEDPGYALHLWDGHHLVSHFGSAAQHTVIAGFDPTVGRIVQAPPGMEG